jgi:DNA-directed RNA polymerase subunit M/transcription elongation factor TFIIS
MVWNKLTEAEANKFFFKIKLKPLEPYISSGTPRKCKCLVCGSIVHPRLGDVKKAKSCVKCQGKLSGKKIRLTPEQIEKITSKMKVKLLEPYENSRTTIKAKCLICGNIIHPTIGRLSVGVGCSYCGQLRGAKKRLIPAEVALSDFKKAKLRVLSDYVNSRTAVKVLCLVCKKKSTKTYHDLKSGRRCYTCGRKAATVKRRLDDRYKIEIAARQNLVPIREITNIRENSEFHCLKCDREILMTFASIQRGASCRFCSKTEVDPLEAEKYMIKNHLKPQEPYFKSAAPWKCRCMKCKNIVYPTYNRVTTFGGGCIYCRSAGYNPSFEGHLYLLFNPKFDSYKVGISNIKARVRVHELKGWIVVRKWDFEDGRLPPVLEEKLLDYIRIKWKLPWSVEAKAMPQGGHTETFSGIGLPEAKVIRLINSMIKSLQESHA